LQRNYYSLYIVTSSCILISRRDHVLSFYGEELEELSGPRPTPKLEGHPLSAVRECLFSIFAATLRIGGRSSIRSLRTRHFVVTGTHLTRAGIVYQVKIYKNLQSVLHLNGHVWSWTVAPF